MNLRNTPRLRRVSLFLLGGGSAAVLNLALVYTGVDVLGFDSGLQQNYVNVVTMEVSLVYSFLVYKAFVWRDDTPYASRAFLQQLSLYHLSAGSSVLARILLFPLLQVAGVHYLLNVAVGIVAGAAINYVLSDRYVFTDPGKRSPGKGKSA
jgi:dolichol-phosphate mannosyltransferase